MSGYAGIESTSQVLEVPLLQDEGDDGEGLDCNDAFFGRNSTTPPGPPEGPRHGPTVGPYGVVDFYERGKLVRALLYGRAEERLVSVRFYLGLATLSDRLHLQLRDSTFLT